MVQVCLSIQKKKKSGIKGARLQAEAKLLLEDLNKNLQPTFVLPIDFRAEACGLEVEEVRLLLDCVCLVVSCAITLGL